MRTAQMLGTLGAVLTAAAVAIPALAVDGVIEINQAAVLAGNITPGDTPGFPATLSLGGSYRLTGNLDVSQQPTPQDVTAVKITAADATLDLNGFSIVGPTSCQGTPPSCMPTGSGKGVDASGWARATVNNGVVRGMGDRGVDLGFQGVVEKVHAFGNGGIGILFELSGRLVSNIAEQNGDDGIACGQGSVLTGNVTNRNGGDGISAGESVMSNNVAILNASAGIRDARASLVTGNTAISNTGVGLALGQASAYGNNSVEGNNGGNANPQVTNGTQVATNLCGGDTTCP